METITNSVNSYDYSRVDTDTPWYTLYADKMTDENIARDLSRLTEGETVTTEKQINWQANGLARLTKQQAAYLKGKYDIKHMDAQSYYNLMSDLTNINVLSVRDVVEQFVKQEPPSMAVSASVSQLNDSDRALSFTGNMLEKFKKSYAKTAGELTWLETSEGQSANPVYYDDSRRYLQREQDLYESLYDIFRSIS